MIIGSLLSTLTNFKFWSWLLIEVRLIFVSLVGGILKYVNLDEKLKFILTIK